jgi:hypothetical protein
VSAAHVFVPENPLAKILEGPDLQDVAELVRAAEARVEALAPRLAASIAGTIDRLTELGRQREELVFADSLEIGRCALDVAELAAAVGRDQLGQAARGAYIIIQGLVNRGAWHTEALMLHVEAMQLLSAEPAPSREDGEAILRRLAIMRRSLALEFEV